MLAKISAPEILVLAGIHSCNTLEARYTFLMNAFAKSAHFYGGETPGPLFSKMDTGLLSTSMFFI